VVWSSSTCDKSSSKLIKTQLKLISIKIIIFILNDLRLVSAQALDNSRFQTRSKVSGSDKSRSEDTVSQKYKVRISVTVT
jgi:hypothetical protein